MYILHNMSIHNKKYNNNAKYHFQYVCKYNPTLTEEPERMVVSRRLGHAMC